MPIPQLRRRRHFDGQRRLSGKEGRHYVEYLRGLKVRFVFFAAPLELLTNSSFDCANQRSDLAFVSHWVSPNEQNPKDASRDSAAKNIAPKRPPNTWVASFPPNH